jgi:metallo-beta-lactamase class B
MKFSMKFAVLIFSISISFTGKAQQCTSPLSITHLSGNCYAFTTCNLFGKELYPSNGMYLVTQSGVVMIDTPWDTTQFQPLLDSIQKRHQQKVVLCISTHFHNDRTAGLAYYRSVGIRTYTSLKTYRLCMEQNEKTPQFTFEDDTLFTVGNHHIETYYGGAGHSPDNIVVWLPEHKILYGGCLVKSTETDNIGNLSDARLDEWPVTLKKVIKKFSGPHMVIPGHLGWGNRRSLQHTLKLLKRHQKETSKKN